MASIILIYLSAGSYALVIGTLVSDREVAMALTPITITPLMLFAGFFIDQGSIPWYLYEFEYISFFKYGFQALTWVSSIFLYPLEPMGRRQLPSLPDIAPRDQHLLLRSSGFLRGPRQPNLRTQRPALGNVLHLRWMLHPCPHHHDLARLQVRVIQTP